MATQLIRLPWHLMNALLHCRTDDRWPIAAGGQPAVFFERKIVREQESLILIAVEDPALAWDYWALCGTRVSVLALAAVLEPSRDLMPRPFPDDIVDRTIEAALPLLGAVLGGGHDTLELAELLEAAKRQPNRLPLPWIRRAPRSRSERRLRETALWLQGSFGGRLERLDQKITVYGNALLQSRLGPSIDSVSTQGAVADWLSLKPDAAIGGLRMLHDDPSHRRDLRDQNRKANAMRKAMRWLVQDLAPYAPQTRWALSAFHIIELHRMAVAENAPYPTSLWRRDNPRCSIFPYSVPAHGIEAALRQLANAFDRQLLAGIHPILVAVLGMLRLMHGGPFGRDDGDTGRLFLQALLRRADLPPTPLPLILHQRYWEHCSILEMALERRDPVALVEAMIAALEEALAAGMSMIAELDRERARLLAALAKIGTRPRDAADVVADLQSNVLARRWDQPEDVPPDITCFEREMRHLHATGLIDLVAAGGMTWWSSAVTRRVAAS